MQGCLTACEYIPSPGGTFQYTFFLLFFSFTPSLFSIRHPRVLTTISVRNYAGSGPHPHVLALCQSWDEYDSCLLIWNCIKDGGFVLFRKTRPFVTSTTGTASPSHLPPWCHSIDFQLSHSRRPPSILSCPRFQITPKSPFFESPFSEKRFYPSSLLWYSAPSPSMACRFHRSAWVAAFTLLQGRGSRHDICNPRLPRTLSTKVVTMLSFHSHGWPLRDNCRRLPVIIVVRSLSLMVQRTSPS